MSPKRTQVITVEHLKYKRVHTKRKFKKLKMEQYVYIHKLENKKLKIL